MTAPHALPQNDQIGALVRSVVQLTAEHTGRGPTKVRTTMGPDVICIVLADTLTKSERLLIASGQAELVAELRRTCFAIMRPAMEAAVREITGRDLLAVLSDHCTAADVSSVSFVFAPELSAYPTPELSEATAHDGRDIEPAAQAVAAG